MKKINKTRGFWILAPILFILFFIQDRFWGVGLNLSVAGRNNAFDEVAAGLCLLLWLCSLFFYHPRGASRRRYLYRGVVFGLFVSVAVAYILGSVMVFDEDIFRIWRAMFWFSGIFIYFFLMRTVGNEKHAAKVFKFLVVYGFVASIFTILVVYVPLFSELVRSGAINQRFGLTRFLIAEDGVPLACFFFLASIFVSSRADGSPLRIPFYWIGFGLTLFCIVFVGLSRQKFLPVLAIILVASVFSLILRGLSKKAGVLLVGLFLLAPSVIALQSSESFVKVFLSRTMRSFDTSLVALQSEASLSYLARQKAISFYHDQFVRTHYVGIGWISSVGKKANNEFVRAETLMGMKLIDLGLIGSFFRFGFIAIVVYLIFLIMVFRHIVFLFRLGDTSTRVLALCLGMFMASKILSLNSLFFHPPFCLFYGIVMYLLDAKVQYVRLSMGDSAEHAQETVTGVSM
jgi:hypothetical protein